MLLSLRHVLSFCSTVIESGIKVGVRLLNFEKNSMIFFLKNDRNALIDVNMNQNFDVKIFRRGLS